MTYRRRERMIAEREREYAEKAPASHPNAMQDITRSVLRFTEEYSFPKPTLEEVVMKLGRPLNFTTTTKETERWND